MCKVADNIFFENYINLYIHKNLSNKLFILFLLFSFSFFQQYSMSYAMQTEVEEFVEQRNVGRSVVQSREENLNLIPHEEERSQSWKKSWFVKNVIAEFPIIGDFFHDDLSKLDTLKKAGHSTFMLLGGSIGMMLDVVPKSEYDDMASNMAKNTINMAIGMWAGTTIYNTVLSLGHAGYNCVKRHSGRNLQTSIVN